MKDESMFLADLAKAFPELTQEIMDPDYKGLLVLQLSSFKRFTQQKIEVGDQHEIERCFGFVAENLNQVNFKVQNSLVISYLGKLDFSKNPETEDKLPVKLRNLLEKLNNHSDKN